MSNPEHNLTRIPVDGVIFDCDSTLSTIEGIDELAALAGVKEQVATLTDLAMDGKVPLQEVYDKRLELIHPTRHAIEQVSQLYLEHIVPGAKETIATLQERHIHVAIVSGGLFAAILPLARYLGVNESDVFAVQIAFDEQDKYRSTLPSPLTTADGKYSVTKQWKAQHQLKQVVLIGDGVSDVAALGAADVVIGYGGVVKRAAVQQSATYFYEQQDLRGLLDLI